MWKPEDSRVYLRLGSFSEGRRERPLPAGNPCCPPESRPQVSLLPCTPSRSTEEVPPKSPFLGELVSQNSSPVLVVSVKGTQCLNFPRKIPWKGLCERRQAQSLPARGLLGAHRQSSPLLSWGRKSGNPLNASPLSLHSLPDLWIPTTLIQRNKEQLTGLGIY